MIKFFVGLAVIAFTSFCGYLFAGKYKKRRIFFTQLQEFNERFLAEVSYYRRPIKTFIAQFAYKAEFAELLKEVFTRLETHLQLDEGMLSGETFSFLKNEEKQIVYNYFMMLGRGDSTAQKGYFSAMKDKLSMLQKDGVTQYKRYADLYIKLGFLFGLLILILIV